MDASLHTKVALLLEGIPVLLREQAHAQYEFLRSKKPSISSVEIYMQMETYVRLLSSAFTNPRTYLQMYNRHFIEEALASSIEKLLQKDGDFVENDFYGIGRVNFDLNGLKALNDLSGHDAGNRGLRVFADILKGGETTKYIESLGFSVVPSAESAEEFGILIRGDGDLRPHTQDIATRYFKEIFHADVSWLINFAHPRVRERLINLGLGDDIPANFHFKISANIGIVLFGEALAHVPIETIESDYDKLVHLVIAKMFAIADVRAHAHRSAFKDELGKKNPLLSGMYARLSSEVLHLEKEINRRDVHIAELEAQLHGDKNSKTDLKS